MYKFKIAYSYNHEGVYIGEVQAQLDKNGEVLVPANATEIEPLKPKAGYDVVFNGTKWAHVKIVVPVVEPEPVIELTWEQKRLAEYPTIEECIHALLDGGKILEDLQTLRQEVKEKYPKE